MRFQLDHNNNVMTVDRSATTHGKTITCIVFPHHTATVLEFRPVFLANIETAEAESVRLQATPAR